MHQLPASKPRQPSRLPTHVNPFTAFNKTRALPLETDSHDNLLAWHHSVSRRSRQCTYQAYALAPQPSSDYDNTQCHPMCIVIIRPLHQLPQHPLQALSIPTTSRSKLVASSGSRASHQQPCFMLSLVVRHAGGPRKTNCIVLGLPAKGFRVQGFRVLGIDKRP